MLANKGTQEVYFQAVLALRLFLETLGVSLTVRGLMQSQTKIYHFYTFNRIISHKIIGEAQTKKEKQSG